MDPQALLPVRQHHHAGPGTGQALAWQKMFVDKFAYDPNETYELSVHDNPQRLGDARWDP